MTSTRRNTSDLVKSFCEGRDGQATSRGAISSTDVRITGAELYLLPVETRVPLKFGSQTLTSVTCARVRLQVTDAGGRSAWGWGETPLNVQWAWPGEPSVAERHEAMIEFCRELVRGIVEFEAAGHPLEIGRDLLDEFLPRFSQHFDAAIMAGAEMPRLAALVCISPFDIALHDAYGMLHGVPTYETYTQPWMNHDLSYYLEPGENSDANFHDKYPRDFFDLPPKPTLTAWHLVGGLDPLDRTEIDSDPGDSLPVLLDDWITRDGLICLKIKLRGNDADWDYERIVRVGRIALARGVQFLSTDFNCTVAATDYVTGILDRLAKDEPAINDLILYIEQPFAYELAQHPADVSSVSRRKPLLMDESAHDWRQVRSGRALGWTGVALKTCKTQTGALLSLAWAKAHAMDVMVQDLTNPMLAQIPHVLLAAHAGTLMGVESNSMQFYPNASRPEAGVHGGLYLRSGGQLNLATIRGPGFGYRGAEAVRTLPEPAASYTITGDTTAM